MAHDVDVPDSEQSGDGVLGLLVSAVDDELLGRLEEIADPAGEGSVEPHADAVRNDASFQLLGGPHIQNNCLLVLGVLVYFGGGEVFVDLFLCLLIEEGLEFVEVGIVAEVGRGFGHVLQHLLDKIIFVACFEPVVVLLLGPQSAEVSLPDRLSA